MSTLRRWLETNKVFFDVFAAVVLGGMAVIVSWSALSVARHEAAVTEAEVSAQLRGDVHLEFDASQEKYTRDVLQVFNDGFRIKDVTLSPMVFLQIDDLSDSQFGTRLVPVTYYFNSAPSGNPTGLLATFRGNDNNSQAARIDFEVRDFARSNPKQAVRVDVVRYVRVEFTDVLGRRLEETIHVPSVGGSRLLSASEASAIRRVYDEWKKAAAPLELGTTTGRGLVEGLRGYPVRPSI